MSMTKRAFLKNAMIAPGLAAPAILMTGAGPTQAASHANASASPAPGYYKYRVGGFTVTALLDGHSTLPAQMVLGYEEEAAEISTREAYRRFAPGAVTIPVNGYVVDTGTSRVLIDAGAPAFIGEDLGGLADNLAAAGITADEIDTVLMTHLHPDHVGALMTSAGEKAFKNAKLVCSEADWSFAHNDDIRAAAPKEFQGMIDLVRGFVAPYQDQLEVFSGEKELIGGITSIPLPGHTPGHSGFAIHSDTESLLIWGDVIHFSTLQFAHPDWGVVFDTDPALAAQTRATMLDRAAADRMAVAGMHIDFPGFGYVERHGDAYRHINAPWMPS